jgi:copper chaperone CopZ
MKKLTLLLTALTLTFAAPVYATSEVTPAETQAERIEKSGDAHVSVNGLVCDFCARALEKVFGTEEAVESIDVDLDTKIITIYFIENQSLDNDRITTLITDAGYNVEAIHRVE